MQKNHRRFFGSAIFIAGIANIAAVAIKLTGIGSQYLTYESIAIELAACTSILLITLFLLRFLKHLPFRCT